MHDYKDYHKLVCKFAWKMHYKTGIDFDEFLSEFNLVFVESDLNYDPENEASFAGFLCGNIMRRFANMMVSRNRMKNKNIIAMDQLPPAFCYDLMDSILIRDSFFQSDDPVIFSIAEIICSHKLPDSSVKVWLRKKLYKAGFKHQEITDAFSNLREVIDPEGEC